MSRSVSGTTRPTLERYPAPACAEANEPCTLSFHVFLWIPRLANDIHPLRGVRLRIESVLMSFRQKEAIMRALDHTDLSRFNRVNWKRSMDKLSEMVSERANRNWEFEAHFDDDGS